MPNQPIFIRNTVKAAHLILTGYGHWLPNDPRGSGSSEIRKLGLQQLGPIHFGRKRAQPARSELKEFYKHAKTCLDHPTIWFDARARSGLARAFASVIRDRGYTCYACAVLSNHAHFVIRSHRDDSLTILVHLAQGSFEAMHDAALVPPDHPVWADRPYKVYLKTAEQVCGRIKYVEDNPQKEGLGRQTYEFVTPCTLR